MKFLFFTIQWIYDLSTLNSLQIVFGDFKWRVCIQENDSVSIKIDSVLYKYIYIYKRYYVSKFLKQCPRHLIHFKYVFANKRIYNVCTKLQISAYKHRHNCG